MRVMVAHNAYQYSGGEDSVVDAEVALLRQNADEVLEYRRHNDELTGLSKVRAASDALWSRRTVREATELMAAFRPDVLHVHNTFPLISPSLYWAAGAAGIPVVQTLHNFRLLCPQAMFLLDGRVCEDCLGKVPWRGVTRACYRDSTGQSAVLAGMLTLHRGIGTWQHKVTRYIALNEFCRRKFIEGGLPAERLVVKPNFVDFEAPPPQPRDGFLFVGRLSKEKGIDVLLRAAASIATVVKIVGVGPEAASLQHAPHVEAVGSLDGEGVRQQMVQAMALVLPSIWFENFPRTLVEAFAAGLPVLASNLGALPELIEDGVTGLLFEPGNAADLASKMQWALGHPSEMAEMGIRARARYESDLSAGRNLEKLHAIYTDAIAAVAADRTDAP